MASFKTSRPIPERRGQGHGSFTICGQIYHFLDGIPNTQDLVQPRMNQMYFLDVEDALMRRNSRNVNPYIHAYKTMEDELNERRAQNLEVENIVIGMTKDPVINILADRQYPTWRQRQSDIAAIFEGDQPPINVKLILYPHRPDDPNPRNRHHELKLPNPLTDPMVYPLLFPCCDNGYNPRRGRPEDKTVTILQYYRYRLYIRDIFPLYITEENCSNNTSSTVGYNPNWPEIRNNLMPYQKWKNRPDLVCGVFQIKLQAFLDIIQKQLYGVVVNHQYVIEFQKRGLPHAHMVITFHEDDKLRTIEKIDTLSTCLSNALALR
ncbi:hypothetical protein JTB14_003323 [Gonioctena quinquepunctata]|nr:hypothetical protein JTB14_003323 [Gonioctena quinquepunctata]